MNPARNAYEVIRESKLVTCKRCGETRLAWVKLASGKWALTQTTHRRPVYTGQNQHPEAQPGYVYANKLAFHSCNVNALLGVYEAIERDQRMAYLNLNEYMFATYGKDASQWPASCAQLMAEQVTLIAHVFRAASQQAGVWFSTKVPLR